MKTFILIFSIFLGASSLYAQDFTITYEHNALLVKDVIKSAAFYREIMGLKSIPVPDAPEVRQWFSIGNGLQLHLIQGDNSSMVPNKSIHIAYRTSDLDALIAVLKEHSHTFYSWQGDKNVFNVRADGIRQIYLQDPDGYWIEINDTPK